LSVLRSLVCGLPFTAFRFFFHYGAAAEFYPLSLHDALPICLHAAQAHGAVERAAQPDRGRARGVHAHDPVSLGARARRGLERLQDRKSTRLNSSHVEISYAVFCLKKKNKNDTETTTTSDTTG